jgi:hypothetical protein
VPFGVSLRAWETASEADISITTFLRCPSVDRRITTQLVYKTFVLGCFGRPKEKSLEMESCGSVG